MAAKDNNSNYRSEVTGSLSKQEEHEGKVIIDLKRPPAKRPTKQRYENTLSFGPVT